MEELFDLMTEQYWLTRHYLQLDRATEFHHLWPIAQDLLEHMAAERKDPIEMVCGPISTGARNVEMNLSIFKWTIEELLKGGKHIFNQLPFERAMRRIYTDTWLPHHPNEYCHPILDEVYNPLFQSKKIKLAYFIPGWKRSTGATWERDTLKNLRVKIVDLPDSWINDFENKQKTVAEV